MAIVNKNIKIGCKGFVLQITDHSIEKLKERRGKRTEEEQTTALAVEYITNLVQQEAFQEVVRRTPVTHYACIYWMAERICLFVRIYTKCILVGTILFKGKGKILVNENDHKFAINRINEIIEVKGENPWFTIKDSFKKDRSVSA